jgi:serralysin
MSAVTRFYETGNLYIDGLSSAWMWRDGPITYNFPSTSDSYPSPYNDDEPNTDFFQASLSTQDAVRAILEGQGNTDSYNHVNATSVVSFTELEIKWAPDEEADIRIAESSLATPAYTIPISAIGEDGSAGDVWFNDTLRDPRAGNYAYFANIHELGHALGLKHPHETTGGFPLLPADRDGMELTVMSYRDYVGDAIDKFGTDPGNFPQTFMQYDIQALQTMYGADYGPESNSTDTRYSWSPTTGEMSINGVGQGQPVDNKVFLTIWDGGGNDIYDMRAYSDGVVINLVPGAWSITSDTQRAFLEDGHQAQGTVYNAFLFEGDTRSLIEQAYGGSGNDRITGNLANNILKGFDGDDTLSGGRGYDRLEGGDGDDTLNGNGSIFFNDQSRDWLQGGGGDDELNGGFGNDKLQGGDDNDYLNGYSRNDSLQGGPGDDVLQGGDGKDSLRGDEGSDRLSGGPGKDYYIFNSVSDSVAGPQHDVITRGLYGQDYVKLRTIDADTLHSGNQRFEWIDTQGFHNSPGELRYEKTNSLDFLVQADVNGDGAADFEIEIWNNLNAESLDEHDFIL